ncbi:exonuclease V [Glomus cerebriforme]|uniref:Exonuclease V n=1 Tax=Glomus cerebriforme TaxID=658196 RepID=A0A397SQP0_9GLOM|nr:exonuclease V [Glomus cerebriforme]
MIDKKKDPDPSKCKLVKIQGVQTNSDVSSSVINNQEEKSPYAQFRGSKTLFVTDFSSLAWCEFQQHYALIAGGRKETQAMKAGTEIHNELELQDHDIVSILTNTKEDSWGIKLYNLIFGLDSLLTSFKTRELPIFGFVSGLFVYGIIDQVEMKQMGDTFEYEWVISDTKTRMKPFLPNQTNIPPSVKYQLMLYKKLFDELAEGVIDDIKIFQTLQLNPDLEFSNELANFIKINCEDFNEKEKEFKPNLRNLIKVVINHFGKIWKSSNILEVSYKFQKDGRDLGSLYFEYDENQIENHLTKSTKYWKGDRKPEGVPIEEAWKCRNCEFADNCEWRLDKIKELEQKKRALIEITNGRT